MRYIAVDTVLTGRNIRALLRQNHMKISQLGEFLGVSDQAIYKWMRGESAPTLDNCLNMARLFQVHMEDMVEGCDHEEREEDDLSSSFQFA